MEQNTEQLQNIRANLSKQKIPFNDLNQKNSTSTLLTKQLLWDLIRVPYGGQLS